MRGFCLGFVFVALSTAIIGCGGESAPVTADQQAAVDPGTEAEKMRGMFGEPDAQGNMAQPAAPAGGNAAN